MYFDDQREPIPPQPLHWIVRPIAVLMALVATTWGLSVALGFTPTGFPKLSDKEVEGKIVATGSVYLVTLGYWWRVFRFPTYDRRVAIWVFSFLVQGAFSLASIIHILNGTMDLYRKTILNLPWWWGATLVSFILCNLEPKDTEPVAPEA